jgi:4-amino-4-deoxy-L-arabinose transferase-like glycosyltransferase
MYVTLAATVLAKGAPVIIPVLAIVSRSLMARGWRGLWSRHLLWGVPLFLVPLAAWAGAAAAESAIGWDYIRGLTIGQAERRMVEATSHARPAWYYFERFPPLFGFWSLLLPVVVLAVRREWSAGGEARRATGRYLLWFALCFVLFSFVSGKRERYILPLFPAAAAMVAIAVTKLEGEFWARQWIRLPMDIILGLLVLLGGAVAAFPIVGGGMLDSALSGVPTAQAREFTGILHSGSLLLVAGGLSAVVFGIDGLLRRRRREVFPLVPVCAALAVLVAVISAAAMPALDRVKSYAPLVEPFRTSGLHAAILDLQPGPFCLSMDTGEVLVIDGEKKRRQACALLEADPTMVLFVTEAAADKIGKELEGRVRILSSRSVGRRRIVALTGR